MDCQYSFTVSSLLAAPAERVWAHASSFVGVNRELWPLARMTYPAAMARLTPEAVPLGETAFRSWILLFGLVPVEYDDFRLVELVPGGHFSEVSRLLSMLEWRHRRSVAPSGAGCILRDEIAFAPRWRLLGPAQLLAFRLVFRLRHRVLRRLFGRAGGEA